MNRIERRIELKAPVSRVWRAITDYKEFGTWFRVDLEGPFVVGKLSRGRITYPGYEHIPWAATIRKMEHEKLFAFSWPHLVDPNRSETTEEETLVEFRLEKIPNGTLLVLTESGFENLPPDIRLNSFRGNEEGWTEQMKNIENYLKDAK